MECRTLGRSKIASRRGNGRRGFTLLELMVVIAILAALAGLVVTNVDSVTDDARQTVALANMKTAAAAIAGSSVTCGCYSDTRLIPEKFETLFSEWQSGLNGGPKSVKFFNAISVNIFDVDAVIHAFDPVTKRGWNGPYLTTRTLTYPDPAAIRTGSADTWSARGFTSDYGTLGAPALADPWGNPIVLQIPLNTSEPRLNTPEKRRLRSRLISAGPDGKLTTAFDAVYPPMTFAGRGDDLVLFLFQADLDQ